MAKRPGDYPGPTGEMAAIERVRGFVHETEQQLMIYLEYLFGLVPELLEPVPAFQKLAAAIRARDGKKLSEAFQVIFETSKLERDVTDAILADEDSEDLGGGTKKSVLGAGIDVAEDMDPDIDAMAADPDGMLEDFIESFKTMPADDDMWEVLDQFMLENEDLLGD